MASKETEEQSKELIEEIKHYESLLERFQENLTSLNTLKKSLKEYRELKGDEEILAPISEGIFIKANLTKDKKFYVNVGEGIILEKSSEEAESLIKDQLEKTKKMMGQTQKKLENTYKRIQEM